MRAVGLITEYNPFHNGHLHHLQESLRQADAEVAVAVMSGHFLQRGEPALVDKWCRAQMALAAGVDVVVELPLPWACSSAPSFAAGGVSSLNALGGVDALCFGSESGQLTTLQLYADALVAHGKTLEEEAAALLKQGMTYPQARAQLLADLVPDGDLDAAGPNNILGIEYLKALRQTQSEIRPLTIERIGAGYHDETIVDAGEIASATGIRLALRENQNVSGVMPAGAYELLQQAVEQEQTFSPDKCLTLLLGQIFSQAERLDRYYLVDNGIENRLLREANTAADLDALIDGIKSRQFTRTRIQRMLISILLGLEKSQAHELLTCGPRYLHLLAASKKGQEFLAAGRKQRELPLVQNFSRVYAVLKRFYGSDTEEYRQAYGQLSLELKASQIYSLLMKGSWIQQRNRDFYQPLIR